MPVTLVDVAGLVPGAHEGRGLGNQFLTDLNEADVLVHVVDFAVEADREGEQTENHDPREDIDFLERELDMWYLDILEKALKRADEQGAIEYSPGAEEFSIGIDARSGRQVGADTELGHRDVLEVVTTN